MKVVNLFSGPGVGKSTAGAMVYSLLSMAGYAAEYVPEFAKFASFANNRSALDDQIYMFAKQGNRLQVLREQGLDFVVMDGPLPLALLYTPEDYYPSYRSLVWEVFDSYDNVNFFLVRNPDIAYRAVGRNQSEAEAEILCQRTRTLLDDRGVPYRELPADALIARRVVEALIGSRAIAI